MYSKNPGVIALRMLRKASHISLKASQKGSGLLDKVERRTTRIILERSGSTDGKESTDIDHFYYDRFPYLFPVHPALPEVNQRPSVTVFAFLDPKGFYGGIATLLLVAGKLANELGYDLRIAQTTGYSSKNDVVGFLEKNGITIEPKRYSTIDLSKRSVDSFAYLPLHPEDVVVTSAWWDAQIASMLPLKRKFIYLIQDFEPIFYNNSDESALANETYYSEKFIPICNTELLYSYFKANNYKYITDNATWFEPAPAPVVAERKPTDTKAFKKKLFLYGRPAVHRNLYMSALQAIDKAFTSAELSKDEWDIYSAGSNEAPAIKLHSGIVIKNLGKMDLDAYYEWASTIDIAVSPMLAPHPNYPTLELAALGAAVVSTKWETKQDLSNYSKNIIMTNPTIDSMARGIIEASKLSKETIKKNLKSNNINTDWSASLEIPIRDIAQRVLE